MQIPGRKALITHLDNVFASMELKLKESLKEIEFVCTTADVWKACNKGFFGMTINWSRSTVILRFVQKSLPPLLTMDQIS